MMELNSNSKPTYIAITIGPVFETMDIVSTPSALWASSYMFSYIARGLRDRLKKSGIDNESFITPYISDESVLDSCPGVGLLHDHIIFEKPDGFTLKKLSEIRECVLNDVKEKFLYNDKDIPLNDDDKENFLSEYVMISAVEYEASNPISGSDNLINSMELEKAFVAKECINPILALFTNEGNDKTRNNRIKKIAKDNLHIDPKYWQLIDYEGKIRDLGSIAAGGTQGSEKKRHYYYAVVRADGDNVGKTIAELEKKEDFHDFSEKCISFCIKLSKLVKAYNGVTIYAGGDDLLALMPCESNGKHLVMFAREANELFREMLDPVFQKANEARKKKDENAEEYTPSLTFGITLCHKNYPLYEALEDSENLLEGAKRDKEYKDSVSMRLIKHSGKANTIWIKNSVLAKDDELKNKAIGLLYRVIKSGEDDDMLLSAFTKIKLFEKLFNSVKPEQVKNLFVNTFDADFHSGNDYLHDELPILYCDHILNGDILALDKDGKKVETDEKQYNYAAALNNLLRIIKFYDEKADKTDTDEKGKTGEEK